LQVYKVILEQGDPITGSVAGNKILRLCIGAFLMVGKVLCNAYKSSTVYNPVSPLKPIPYENLSQLLKDSFNVYSRGEYLNDIDGIYTSFVEGLYATFALGYEFIRGLNYTQFLSQNDRLTTIHATGGSNKVFFSVWSSGFWIKRWDLFCHRNYNVLFKPISKPA